MRLVGFQGAALKKGVVVLPWIECGMLIASEVFGKRVARMDARATALILQQLALKHLLGRIPWGRLCGHRRDRMRAARLGPDRVTPDLVRYSRNWQPSNLHGIAPRRTPPAI